MSEEFLSQDEVDALLRGASGDSDDDAKEEDKSGGQDLQHRNAGTYCSRAHADI